MAGVIEPTILIDLGPTRPLLKPIGVFMVPVLLSNLLWLVVCGIYAALWFWQAGRDRKNGTGFIDED